MIGDEDIREFLDLVDAEVIDEVMEVIAGEAARTENEIDYSFNDIELVLVAEGLAHMHTAKLQSSELVQACIYRRMFKEITEQHEELEDIIAQRSMKKQMGPTEEFFRNMGMGPGGAGPN